MMKTLIGLIFVAISMVACAPVVDSEGESEGFSIGEVGEEITVSGRVVETIDDCTVDGVCAYVIEMASGEQVTVIWTEGDSPNCANNPFVTDSMVEPEDIEAFGIITAADSISVCGDEDYYILFEDQSIDDDIAEGTRQVSGQVIELIGDCAFDGNCAYVVETDSGEAITVIWAEGMSPICQNDPFQGGDSDIVVGDNIDSLGRVIDDTTISACGDTSYYIHKSG